MEGYKKGGYEKKFHILKADGSLTSPDADYFVLRLDKDPHARKALKTYAESVQVDNKKLAEDLFEILNKYQNPFDEKRKNKIEASHWKNGREKYNSPI